MGSDLDVVIPFEQMAVDVEEVKGKVFFRQPFLISESISLIN